MATDQLVLGGFTFQNSDYSVPDRMPFGGQQAMIVHKLPGGSRVTDTLGPDEDDISWHGFFLTDNALQQCKQLDAMRAAGTQITLTYAGMSRQVVIKHFKARIRRYPHWIEYEISCSVTNNPMLGVLGGAASATGTASPAATADTLIGSDLSTALTSALPALP